MMKDERRANPPPTRKTLNLTRWHLLALLLLAAPLAPSLGAQQLTGYTPQRAASQRAAEAAATTRPDSVRIGALARALADRPHIAGTAAQARTRAS
jgi:N-acetylated-alpha-linked acidic dipeptidase